MAMAFEVLFFQLHSPFLSFPSFAFPFGVGFWRGLSTQFHTSLNLNWKSKILERSDFSSKTCSYDHHTPCWWSLKHSAGNVHAGMRATVVPSVQNELFLWPCCWDSVKEVAVCCTWKSSMKRAVGATRCQYWILAAVFGLHRWRGMVSGGDFIDMVFNHIVISTIIIVKSPCITHTRPRNSHRDILTVEMLVWSNDCHTFTPTRSRICFMLPYVHMRILTGWYHIPAIRGKAGRDLAVCISEPCYQLKTLK